MRFSICKYIYRQSDYVSLYIYIYTFIYIYIYTFRLYVAFILIIAVTITNKFYKFDDVLGIKMYLHLVWRQM